jgi:hypothetical protein
MQLGDSLDAFVDLHVARTRVDLLASGSRFDLNHLLHPWRDHTEASFVDSLLANVPRAVPNRHFRIARFAGYAFRRDVDSGVVHAYEQKVCGVPYLLRGDI